MVIAFTMFFMHPVSLGISLGSALAYAVYLRGRKAIRFSLVFMLPMMAMAALINPAFNHEGATLLTYLPSGNPLTLESILYGLAAAAMLAAVVTWFSCYTAVMTSDKFVYLFGRLIPALSLVLSMALRFVPKFQAQFHVVSEAQRCIGRDVSDGGVIQRIRNAVTIFSIMLTWSLENAIETADSMKSRGYGLPGRTAFSIYRFDDRDRMALGWLLYCGFFLCCGAALGGFAWRYYPTVKGAPVAPLTVCLQAVYLALCLTPVLLNIRADRTWSRLDARNEVKPCIK
ncbi:energy-coupling factor transporter transmembrane component T [Flavonifractor plautii]|uniref:energy-coupling factor transporter transmembrane component T n=1 Tax=Flavonifractor plautii TaxID=292800 RepID=UPI0023306249|nr:energy-coupling factor transporter transmembrane component T [Flavonifractor plautii]MDB7954815.1 energy-coupling factor transporter transmembrane component T [Flavonifractor plautii]